LILLDIEIFEIFN